LDPSQRENSLEVEIARLRSLLRDQETEHEEIVSPLWSNCANLDAENKTLRARVAELENSQAKLESERADLHTTIRDSLASRADLIASLAAHQSTITALEFSAAEESAKATVSKSERTVLKAQLAEASATREADSKEILSLRLQVQSYQGHPFSNDQTASKLGRLSGLEAKMEALRSKQKQPGGPVSSTSALIPPNSMDRLYFHLHLIPDLDAEGKSSVLPSRDKIERLLGKEAKRILNGTEDVQIVYCVTSSVGLLSHWVICS
jgi:chromosome segregation ATPase